MIKYKLSNTENGEILGQFKTSQDAADAMNQYIAETNDGLDPSDEEWLTPFDFDLEEVEVKEAPNEIIVDYNSAREYLGGKANKQFTVSQRVASMNTVPGLMDVTRLVDALNPSHVEALIALNELFTIAQAWNKADDFVPDYSDRRQAKWFPWFVYNNDRAGFVFAYTINAPSSTFAYVGSRLCFKPKIAPVNSANNSSTFGTKFFCSNCRCVLL